MLTRQAVRVVRHELQQRPGVTRLHDFDGKSDPLLPRPQAGLLGGAFALLLTWLAQALVSRYVLAVAFLPAWMGALGVALGGALGLLGSLLSVGRHLRLVGGERRRVWG